MDNININYYFSFFLIVYFHHFPFVRIWINGKNRARGIPTHLIGPQPNGGRQEQQQQQQHDNENNSSDTSVEDSKIQFQNNLRKFKAKCDNELEKLLEKCENRRKTYDRKMFTTAETSTKVTTAGRDVSSKNLRKLDSNSCNNVNSKDENETGSWIVAYNSFLLLLWWRWWSFNLNKHFQYI